MRRWLLFAIVACGCATTGAQTRDAPLESCTLDSETACVEYAADAAPTVKTPAGQLVVGLADRAAELPATEAVDYWRRIVEVMSASDDADTVVNRRAAPSFAAIAAFAVDDVGGEKDSIEATLEQSHEAVDRVRGLTEFAVAWGTPTVQADAVASLAAAYERQADTLAAFELPEQLTMTGRASLGSKRDAIVRELRAEAELLREGLAKHCAEHQLDTDACP